MKVFNKMNNFNKNNDIVYSDQNNVLKLSVRARDERIDVNASIKPLEKLEEIMSAGGHKQAGGITFKDDNITMDKVLEFIRTTAWSNFK